MQRLAEGEQDSHGDSGCHSYGLIAERGVGTEHEGENAGDDTCHAGIFSAAALKEAECHQGTGESQKPGGEHEWGADKRCESANAAKETC